MYDLDFFFKQWNRPFNEVSVGTFFDTENGVGVIINAVGIDKDDLKIEQKGKELLISAKTELKEIQKISTINYSLDISRWINRLNNIQYELKNGYLYVFLNLAEEKKVLINYKD